MNRIRNNDIDAEFMYTGTIVENSLDDKAILKKLRINKTWQDEDWILHSVSVDENQLTELSHSINNGPWYIHVWKEGQDEVQVIFKDKIFHIQHSDKSTWNDAIEYGKSIGIPENQLDFKID